MPRFVWLFAYILDKGNDRGGDFYFRFLIFDILMEKKTEEDSRKKGQIRIISLVSRPDSYHIFWFVFRLYCLSYYFRFMWFEQIRIHSDKLMSVNIGLSVIILGFVCRILARKWLWYWFNFFLLLRRLPSSNSLVSFLWYWFIFGIIYVSPANGLCFWLLYI